jgi:hypothetical protein
MNNITPNIKPTNPPNIEPTRRNNTLNMIRKISSGLSFS